MLRGGFHLSREMDYVGHQLGAIPQRQDSHGVEAVSKRPRRGNFLGLLVGLGSSNAIQGVAGENEQ